MRKGVLVRHSKIYHTSSIVPFKVNALCNLSAGNGKKDRTSTTVAGFSKIFQCYSSFNDIFGLKKYQFVPAKAEKYVCLSRLFTDITLVLAHDTTDGRQPLRAKFNRGGSNDYLIMNRFVDLLCDFLYNSHLIPFRHHVFHILITGKEAANTIWDRLDNL